LLVYLLGPAQAGRLQKIKANFMPSIISLFAILLFCACDEKALECKENGQ
jgi:hypothetical protein